MKNHKQWKHKKEFDTKTLFEDLRMRDKNSDENSESSAKKGEFLSEEKSEQNSAQFTPNTIPKNTRIHISSTGGNSVESEGSPAKKTRVYEPRPLTPDDDIYEDIL